MILFSYVHGTNKAEYYFETAISAWQSLEGQQTIIYFRSDEELGAELKRGMEGHKAGIYWFDVIKLIFVVFSIPTVQHVWLRPIIYYNYQQETLLSYNISIKYSICA